MLDIKIVMDGRKVRFSELPAIMGPSLAKLEIAELVSALIDQLDDLDGDPDLEPDDLDHCTAGDDGAGVHYWNGEAYWGCEQEAGHYRMLPRYDIDQTKGPINEVEILRQYHRDLRNS